MPKLQLCRYIPTMHFLIKSVSNRCYCSLQSKIREFAVRFGQLGYPIILSPYLTLRYEIHIIPRELTLSVTFESHMAYFPRCTTRAICADEILIDNCASVFLRLGLVIFKILAHVFYYEIFLHFLSFAPMAICDFGILRLWHFALHEQVYNFALMAI